MNWRILVLGISGVGKTRACKSFAVRHPGTVYISAGELLREVTNIPEEALREADADAILRNQEPLAAAIIQRSNAHPDSNILFDAHVIVDNGREIIRVPLEIIRSLRPSAMILLEASPAEVLSRRHIRGVPQPMRGASDLASQMKIVQDVVLGYARDLNVPLKIVTASGDFILDGPIDALSGMAA